MSSQSAASTLQCLEQSTATPITGVPATLAAWVYPRTLPTNFVSVGGFDEGSNTFVMWLQNDTGSPSMAYGDTAGLTLGSTWTLNAWNFMLGRFVQAAVGGPSLAYLSHIDGNGLVTHGTGTTNPTVVNTWTRFRIGNISSAAGTNNWDGFIGEMWYTNTDVYPSSGQPTDAFVQMLAFGGPFSMPHIVPNIKAYYSLRDNLTSTTQSQEVYYSTGQQTLTFKGTIPTLGPHCPFAGARLQRYQMPMGSPRTVCIA